MISTLVVGLGSPYGDDQVGWIACEQLKKELGHLQKIAFVTTDRSGLDWLSRISEAGQVVFIDAMRSGEIPGTIRKIDLNTAQWNKSAASLSSHGISLNDAIEVAQSLGDFPEVSSVWAIEIDQCNIDSDLSEPVKNMLITLLQGIKSDIQLS